MTNMQNENVSIADEMIAILHRVQNNPRETPYAMVDLQRVQNDVQSIAYELLATPVPDGLTDAGDILNSALDGLGMLQDAARKIRQFAQSRKIALVVEATTMARQAIETIDAVQRYNEQRISELIDESQVETGNDIKQWMSNLERWAVFRGGEKLAS